MNVLWVPFFYKGFPFIATVASADIKKGDELLTHYGEMYSIFDYMDTESKILFLSPPWSNCSCIYCVETW